MKQVVHRLKRGHLELAQGPDPAAGPNELLIANRVSLVSAGTESYLRRAAKKSLVGKALERPSEALGVLEKVRRSGVRSTWNQVGAKLDESLALGYSSAGSVLACGQGVSEFKVGDRVASNGPHATAVVVPKHLCALVPDAVGYEDAAFTVLGAIALQGVRLARVGLGDRVLVIGLGLVGQIAVALLKAAGCRVIATDLDERRCQLGRVMGAEFADVDVDPGAVHDFSKGIGADAVLITAATSSNQPIEVAGKAVRQKGRVVAVGLVGLDIPRRDFYFKEAEVVVSCSYGPGRYDRAYEEHGLDYPAAYVRWTEQRNMQAVLDLTASGRLDLSPLVSHRFPIDAAEKAYQLMEENSESYMGILLEYPECGPENDVAALTLREPRPTSGPSLGLIGAGQFACGVLLPAIKKAKRDVRLRSVCTRGGNSAADVGRRFGFEVATSDLDAVLTDPEVNSVVIATRHRGHGAQVLGALRAKKHVLIEKPLAVSLDEVAEIEEELLSQGAQRPVLQVGFNRRFSPAAQRARDHFSPVSGPLTVVIRVNAGSLPADHWTQDPAEGGRIIGEACHFIDLATFLTGSVPLRVFAESVGGPNAPEVTDDRCLITLRHANGSVSSIAYVAGGDRAVPKERIEILGGERVAIIHDFRSLELFAGGRRRRKRWLEQDKGHQAEVNAFLEAVRDGSNEPIPWEEIRSVSLAAILAVRSLREGQPVEIAS